jgi:hypothetical protein
MSIPGSKLIDRLGVGNAGVSRYALSQTSEPALETLYTFTGGSNGSIPYAGVIVIDGVRNGTTLYGGSSGYGVVYSLTAPAAQDSPWLETTLYSFTGSSDGAYPGAPRWFGDRRKRCTVWRGLRRREPR